MAFRFRAQAALDLRTRELEVAQRELARAQGDRDAAGVRVEQANAALEAARTQAAEALRTATTCTALQWYQSWILRLSHERKAHNATLAAREEAVTRAAAACLRAQQRREALDRFREKARASYEAAQAATERKLIDELATRRYATTRQSALCTET
ncbi:MAG TPA: flagellar export protein FliJ [Vicinamibacterales bacterium]